MRIIIALLLFLVCAPASAQQQQQISIEQSYRQVNTFLAQENARLGADKEQLKQRLDSIFADLARAQARIKELESKGEEKKP